MTEWEFLNEVVELADCGILLDVNNIYVSSQNHNFDPHTYVNSVPAERVAQIHIAGHSKFEKYILDTHDHPVLDPVWGFYARAIERCGPTATLLEWDDSTTLLRGGPRRSSQSQPLSQPAGRDGTSGGDGMNAPELHALQQRMAAAVMQRRLRATSRCDVAMPAIAPWRRNRLSSSSPTIASAPSSALKSTTANIGFGSFLPLRKTSPASSPSLEPDASKSSCEPTSEASPSRSFSLRNLGSSLVAWLRSNPQYTNPMTDDATAMAALEWAHIEAFDNEKRPSLTPEEIASIDDTSRLSLQPYLRLVEAPSAVDDALIAVRDASAGAAAQASNAVSIHLVRRTRSRKPAPGKIYLAVHRYEDSVYYKRVAREDFLLMQAIESGSSLGEAIEAAFQESSMPESDRAAYIQSSFHYLMQMGWLCTSRTSETV